MATMTKSAWSSSQLRLALGSPWAGVEAESVAASPESISVGVDAMGGQARKEMAHSVKAGEEE